MTQEEKEKVYIELINRLEDVKEAIKKQNYGIAMDILCKPYPDFQITTSIELADSEDEKIRKELLQIANESEDSFYMVMTPDKRKHLINWLEKQGNLMKALQISNAKIGELIEENYYLKEQLEKQGKNNMGISEATKQKLEDNLNKALEKETPESLNKFLDEQGEQKPTIEMITPEESLGIDSDTYNKIVDECVYGEQNPAEWHREDEQNLNACLGYIPDEYLRKWLTDAIHVKYNKPAELPKGEDYGIDGLYAAIDILQKTLGKVDGYQSDDGILEHKCAISAVKELSKQKPAWSEEDNKMSRFIGNAITVDDASIYLESKGIQVIDAHVWLNGLKDKVQPKQEWSDVDKDILFRTIDNLKFLRDTISIDPKYAINIIDIEREITWLNSLKPHNTWKPSDEQMEALACALSLAKNCGEECAFDLRTLHEQLKKLTE